MSLFNTTSLTFALLATLGLAACQSPSSTKAHTHRTTTTHANMPEKMAEHMRKEQRGWKKLTPEQRAEFQKKAEQRRTERQARFEMLQKACEGKAGQTINVKLNDKTVEGQCEVHFRPTRDDKNKS
ncbi:MAG: hypothetical protein E6Q25_10040 [Acinetobacter sp.]|nr:MAG: hypothetical protein E6Q25_10040 [Acinetobacter sp.]